MAQRPRRLFRGAATTFPDTLAVGEWGSSLNHGGNTIDSVKPSPLPPGVTGHSGLFAYSGGVWDDTQKQLLVWGGGHDDYGGNELYACPKSTQTWVRLIEPSSNTDITNGHNANSGNGQDPLDDGKPSARHTLDMLAHVPGQNCMIAVGAIALYGGGGGSSAKTWKFNLSTNTWSTLDDYPHSGNSNWRCAIGIGSSVYVWEDRLRILDVAAGTWSAPGGLDTSIANIYYRTLAYDSTRSRLVLAGLVSGVGGFGIRERDLTGADHTAVTLSDTTDLDALVGTSAPFRAAPPWAFHPPTGTFITWGVGRDIIEVTPTGGTWTVSKLTNRTGDIPPNIGATSFAIQETGTHKRFQYAGNGLFVTVNSTTGGTFWYRHS